MPELIELVEWIGLRRRLRDNDHDHDYELHSR